MAANAEVHLDAVNPLDKLGLDRRSARVLIFGLGKTGLSVARFLVKQGIEFAVTDTREWPPYLAELRETCPDAGVFLGGLHSAAFSAATHLIVSPGVSLDQPKIREARRRGIPVFGDLDLFACMANAPILAITGANGKSTVTTLVGLMAEADGRNVRVGGNLGTPMLELLDDQAELYVLELSSFQLERSSLLKPAAATVLNISPDHMDRYPDIKAYADAKRLIFRGQGVMVLNRDDPMVAAMAEPDRRRVWFGLKDSGVDYGVSVIDGAEWLTSLGEPLMQTEKIAIQGRHNVSNALAAVALGEAIGLSRAAMTGTLERFEGLAHRMQKVAEIEGVTWINDSKATNVGACMAALSGLHSKAVLIAGGDGKDAEFSILRPVVAEKVRAAVLMGKDAPLLEQALKDVVPTVRVENMRQAVQAARSLARSGDSVLLAPACASLDQYKDYQERGRVFTEAVKDISL
ncbi:UDP-N-acetylmuramoyl-L-alanine--D-glutamate ligase [Methylocaldum sp.]|uniref:UDP-N-acetylmuramoyl-L-alanine--D-glutamate ligase n=1 Tax=Methylocaldum sp. TaxID=1969727 RepID=UPI002D73D279|nr:UDP-N-acetylmuramoyl-L-alanine--D-glutamate ligase [Methylocaldum sp.]HYE35825.1 UDP-N-acetylmuramoyl-L-alanine--D-glutamate ligase [Methylocaldum sp.]